MSLAATHRRTALGLALAAASGTVAPAAHADDTERFRLARGATMQNDDSGHEGTTGFAIGLPYQVMQGYAIAEGDMVLGRVDSRGQVEIPFQRRGLGQRSAFDRWPDGVVPYAFHPALTDIQKRNIERAIVKLNARTRMLIVPLEDPRAAGYANHVSFEPSGGCASYVGRQLREDAQSLWVSDSCSVGSIVHEISHAIGLFHEHTRPDRDNYVSIAWDEIVKDKAFNFEIYNSGVDMWGDYDYGSIMHYGEYFFSRSGKRTIVAPSNVDIGQRQALSDGDIAAIDNMYATDLSLRANVIETDRGFEIDVSVTNLGALGARELTLRASGGGRVDWRSVSADSGWNCLAYGAELRCELFRLGAQASTRFTIVVDAATTGVEQLALELEARTLDPNPTNNVVPEGTLELSDTDAEVGQPAAARPDGPAPGTPGMPGMPTESAGSTGSVESSETTESRTAPVSRTTTASKNVSEVPAGVENDASGGGGASVLALALLPPLLARVRRRRRLPLD